MLTADELGSMRSTISASLPDTAAVRRMTVISDGAGGEAVTEATVAIVPCRLAPGGGGQEGVVGERMAAAASWSITFPADTDVTPRDRVVIGSRTFEVQAGVGARTWETGRRVLAVETT